MQQTAYYNECGDRARDGQTCLSLTSRCSPRVTELRFVALTGQTDFCTAAGSRPRVRPAHHAKTARRYIEFAAHARGGHGAQALGRGTGSRDAASGGSSRDFDAGSDEPTAERTARARGNSRSVRRTRSKLFLVDRRRSRDEPAGKDASCAQALRRCPRAGRPCAVRPRRHFPSCKAPPSISFPSRQCSLAPGMADADPACSLC